MAIPHRFPRPPLASAAFLLLLATSSLGVAEEPTFRDLLGSVKTRESRTGAIRTVAASAEQRAKGASATFHHFTIRIEAKKAHVELYNNYLTGKQGVTYIFPVTAEVESEHARLQNLTRLQQLDQAVAEAERRRRIFVLSSFRLEEGSGADKIEAVFGKPTTVNYWMKSGWSTLIFRDVSVTTAFGRIQDIHSSRRD